MVMGLLGFCGMGGKLMLPVRGKLMGKVTEGIFSAVVDILCYIMGFKETRANR
jgi:hypothetical protein